MARQILGKVKVTPKGAYKSGTNYEVLDIVTYNGGSYIARTNTSAVPTNSTYWQLLAEKGDDYVMTEDDFQAIVREITEDAESIFNQNARSKTEDFNNNATSKKNDFNSNATSKTSAYNSNADEKVGAYNSNATSKLNAYNTNDTAKTKTYNDNAKTLLDAYNNNASSVVTGFNDNAIARLNEYNRNADTKVANLEERTSELNEMLEEEGIIQRDLIRDEGESYDRRITANSNEIYRIKDDILETGEASGSYVTLKDSTMAEYQELEIDGVCEQITTTGKNFCGIPNQSFVHEGVTVTINDGEFTLNGTATGTSVKYLEASSDIKIDGDVTFNRIYVSGRFEFPTNASNINIRRADNREFILSLALGNINENAITHISQETSIMFGLYIIAGNVFNNYKFKPQLVRGTDADYDFEPFTGGQASPNPSYPQPISVIEDSIDITSSNKNLLIDTNWKNCTIANTGIENVGNDRVSTDFIEIKSSTYYTFSNKSDLSNNFLGFAYYDSTKTFLSRDSGNGIITFSRQTPNNAKYMRFFSQPIINIKFTQDKFKEYEFMLVEGTTAIPFEEHLESKITANLGDEFIAKINDIYKDTLSVEYNFDDGEYHLILNKMIGKVVLDGSEEWMVITTNISGKNRFKLSASNLNMRKSENINEVANAFSNFFIPTSASGTYLNKNGFCIDVKDYIIFYDDNLSSYSLNEFISWLSTNKPIVYYQLATPYEVDLGVVDMPITYNEVTNLYTNSDLLPIITAKYYRTFEKTIKNLQVDTVGLQAQLRSLEERYQAILTALPRPTSEIESEVE